jgi:hypothetical protein
MASRAAAASGILRAAAQQSYRRPAAAVLQSRSAATATAAHPGGAKAGSKLPRGDYVPVYVALGLIALSVTLGLSTAKQQLAHAPNVRVDKKKRETVPEVAAPDLAVDEGERFVDKSLFRKVAHVQDDRSLAAGVADPVAEYPYVVAALCLCRRRSINFIPLQIEVI